MRILQVHESYQQTGGEDAVALAEKQLLDEHGHDVVCYTGHNDKIGKFGLKENRNFVDALHLRCFKNTYLLTAWYSA